MITKEILTNLNKDMPTVDIKGKNYVMVNDRIKRVREFIPGARIETEIVKLDDGVVTMKASLFDDVFFFFATGHAQEKESSNFINSTSFVENCETSCIGRCLAIAGIGIDDSIGSADEVANAITNQRRAKEESKPVSDREKRTFMDLCALLKQEPKDILRKVGWKEGQKMTAEHHGKALIILKEIEESMESI